MEKYDKVWYHKKQCHEACSCKDLNESCLSYWHSGISQLVDFPVLIFICSMGDSRKKPPKKHSNHKLFYHFSEFRGNDVAQWSWLI